MKNLILLTAITALVSACASNPNRAVMLDTQLEHVAPVSSGETVGTKDGLMVVQKKTQMNEELRRLQNEVYELEDHVYGNRKYGSLGLYGVVRECRSEVSEKANGGDGMLTFTEPLDRVTDKEAEYQMGLDENGAIVGVSEEFLKERTSRFAGYKQVLQKRQDSFEEALAICQAQLKSQKFETTKQAQGEAQ